MEEKKINITFDLETLGNTSAAPIVQIGAVKFTDEGEILDKFLVNVDIEKLTHYGDAFKMDYSTIFWWLNQDIDAIRSVYSDGLERVILSEALHKFFQWIGSPGDYVYWSHATFDPPILVNNFKACRKDCPIPFRAYRDIRTLTHFAGVFDIPREGVHHNALDDCIFQAKYISEGFKRMKK